jgi:hypothetical protein
MYIYTRREEEEPRSYVLALPAAHERCVKSTPCPQAATSETDRVAGWQASSLMHLLL